MPLDYENNDRAYLLGRFLGVAEKYITVREGEEDLYLVPKFMQRPLPNLQPIYKRAPEILDDEEAKEIMNRLSIGDIPSNLPVEEQGAVCIGYWHQKIEFQKRNKNKNKKD